MDVYETIKNIRSVCNNYMDPDLVATVIDDNYYMGSNSIDEMQGYDISDDDSYEENIYTVGCMHAGRFPGCMREQRVFCVLILCEGLRRRHL